MPNHTIRATSAYNLGYGVIHVSKSARMLLETSSIMVGLCGLTFWSHKHSVHSLLWISMFLQGCWMQRVYCVGHESAHRKLFSQNIILNNTVGQVFLWILLVPLSIFERSMTFITLPTDEMNKPVLWIYTSYQQTPLDFKESGNRSCGMGASCVEVGFYTI